MMLNENFSFMPHVIGLINSENPFPLMLWASFYFLTIYTVFAGLAWGLASAFKKPIETRPVHLAQIRTECLNSMRSIALFGIGMIIPWLMIRLGISNINFESALLNIMLEFVVLILWNDLHFYVIHRILHEKFKRAHAVHHRSIAATPFAAYSMSATEALLLGSVMPLAMLVHDFSLWALLLLPVWSIFINTLSHSNCDFFPNADEHSMLSFVKHHQSHHSRYRGNYSFFFSHLDRWFNTSRPFK